MLHKLQFSPGGQIFLALQDFFVLCGCPLVIPQLQRLLQFPHGEVLGAVFSKDVASRDGSVSPQVVCG